MAPFTMTRAGPEDLDELVPLVYKGFSDPEIQIRFLGPDTPEQQQYNIRLFRTWMEGGYSVWFKVVDTATGKMIAACMWGIDLQGPFPKPYTSRERPWLADISEEFYQNEQNRMAEAGAQRQKHYTMPHLKLNILCTHPDYHRRGAGAMVVQWGCDLADQLSLPTFLEATDEGLGLYTKYGFKKLSEERFATGWFMRREPQPKVYEGGRDL